MIVNCLRSSASEDPRPVPPGVPPSQGEMRVIRVTLDALADLSTVRLYLPKDLQPEANRTSVRNKLGEVRRRLGEVPILDPVADMHVAGQGVEELQARLAQLERRRGAMPFHRADDRPSRLAAYARMWELGETVRLLRRAAKAATTLVKAADLRRMQRVLKKLGYVETSAHGGPVISQKGRVACEINTADEVLVTELVFSGLFVGLPEPETAALLSCLVFQEKPKEGAETPKMRPSLEAAFRQLQETARMIANVKAEAKIDIDVDEYVRSFNPDLADVVYAWTAGSKFVEVVKLTAVYEGSVIRVIRRLDELLRQLASASFTIGNHELKAHFESTASRMRRDIVFAASLYLATDGVLLRRVAASFFGFCSELKPQPNKRDDMCAHRR